MTLSDGSFQLFANPTPSGDSTKDASGNYPQMLLKRLNIDLKIDTVHVKKISVFYTELNQKSKQTGTIIFANTSGNYTISLGVVGLDIARNGDVYLASEEVDLEVEALVAIGSALAVVGIEPQPYASSKVAS